MTRRQIRGKLNKHTKTLDFRRVNRAELKAKNDPFNLANFHPRGQRNTRALALAS